MAPQRFEIEPSGGFSLEAANRYFGSWIEDAGVTEPAVPMAFPVEGWATSAAVLVRQNAAGLVSGEVHGAGRHAEAAWRQALAVLSLDVDGAGFASVGARDPVIGAQQRECSGLRPVLFHSPYEAAVAFLLGHRISIAQGRALRKRIAAELGTAIRTPAGIQYAFPAPQILMATDHFPGDPAAKIERLRGVAQAALDGTLERARLRSLAEADALAELRTIPGVGPFFAQGILMRGAGLVDTVTDDDVTKQAIQRAYNLRSLPGQAKVLEIAEAWRPYRMWALVLLHVWFRRDAGGPARSRR